MGADEILQRQRAYPLTAGLDHILDAILDLHGAVGIDGGHVAGVQPAALPELGAFFRLFQIALRQPGGAYHYLPHGLAIVRHLPALLIDDAQIYQRDRGAGTDPQRELLRHGQRQLLFAQVDHA
ncbi:hypothetical protein D3C75_1104710 [compost metagenome]